MQVFGQITEHECLLRKKIAYTCSLVCVIASISLFLLDLSRKFWWALSEFLLTEIAFFLCIAMLHFKLRKLHKSAFKNERRSIKLQNIVFLVGSVMRDVFLIVLFRSFKSDNNILFCFLLFLSCIKLSVPVLLYMIVHYFTFRQVETLEKKEAAETKLLA